MLDQVLDENQEAPEFSVENVENNDLMFEILDGDWSGLRFRMSSMYHSDGSIQAARCHIEETPEDVDIEESVFSVVAQMVVNEVIKDKPDRLH